MGRALGSVAVEQPGPVHGGQLGHKSSERAAGEVRQEYSLCQWETTGAVSTPASNGNAVISSEASPGGLSSDGVEREAVTSGK